MKYHFAKEAWKTIEEGEKNCYLIANGLGGYQSMNLLGGVTRGDQAFFMSAKRAPNVRRHMITGLLETLVVDGTAYVLTSQRMEGKPDLEGFLYLEDVTYDGYPVWNYRVGTVTVKKSCLMLHGENTVAVQYELCAGNGENVRLEVQPMLRMTAKNSAMKETATLIVKSDKKETQTTGSISDEEGNEMFFSTGGDVVWFEQVMEGPLYFSQDERDGREKTGLVAMNHKIVFSAKESKGMILYSDKNGALERTFEELTDSFIKRREELLLCAGLTSELGRELVLSADAYVVERASTGGKSIIAGYPFFEDWGRDTMIAIPGITLVTGRFEDCKSMLKTFAKYEKNGLLPNLFPEGEENPMYNSVDAPLLFINTVYEYERCSKDTAFAEEIYPVLEDIVKHYEQGTAFHIGMQEDGLIAAGDDLEQLTWMDVRVGDFLPTPRHGKPVEINAYWYSALKVMESYAGRLGKTAEKQKYAAMAEKTKASFLEKFWNEEEGCLKDVLSGNAEENQVRCNQIWTLTQPFVIIPKVWEEKILQKVRTELLTSIGLRTLSPRDKDFHPIYIGPMEERDRAYHQGTVWAFPLGAYLRACLAYFAKEEAPQEWKDEVQAILSGLEGWLQEGCLGQVAEIYDGGEPTVSRGCFAQAWSVGELLRAVADAGM